MIDDDVKITINLNKLVETRAKLQSQYGDYSEKICKGEYLDGNDIDRIASKLRDTLTWDVLYSMVDEAVLEYSSHKAKPCLINHLAFATVSFAHTVQG